MRNRIIPDIMPILIAGSLLVVAPVTMAEECDLEAGTCFGLNWEAVTEKDVQDWLKHQDNVNAVDDGYGTTPLHRVAKNENLTIITALLNAEAEVHAKDKDGDTPLDVAKKYRGNRANTRYHQASGKHLGGT